MFAIIDKIQEQAAKNVAIDDYIAKDGLIHCGKCHTAKQVRIEFLGDERTVNCICDCQAEQLRLERIVEELEEKKRAIEEKRNNSFPDTDSRFSADDMRKWTFSRDDGTNPAIQQIAQKYVENFETFRTIGRGLLLYGDVGTGKSFTACCIANALIDKGYDVLVTSFSRIENTIFNYRGNRQEYYDSLNKNHLLIIDDYGSERNSEYMQEIIYNVIDSRYRVHLPLIVTSNITAEELKNPANTTYKRIFSRLTKMCHPVKFEGEDRRKKEAVMDFATTAKLLGL